MGDRANIYIREDETRGVYLYSHWGGSELPETLRLALVRGRGRWNDGAYLARIIFCEMVAGDEKGLTGFGISARMGDNEHPIIVVDPERMTVTFGREPDPDNDHHTPITAGAKSVSFDAYTKQASASYPRAKG